MNSGHGTARVVILLVTLCATNASAERLTSSKGPIATYHFDEGSGSIIRDSSGNHQDGVLLGNVKWVPGVSGAALQFDGFSRVSIPSSRHLNVDGQVTVTAWIKGHGDGFRLVEEPSSDPSLRSPYFQVCGETLYFASQSDHPLGWWNSNEARLYTGTVDIDLHHWRDERRTRTPVTGLEPKLQVVGNVIYYEYFGQDSEGDWQIWSAHSNVDGSDYTPMPLTQKHRKHKGEQSAVELNVEQGSLRVVGNEIYYFWPERDDEEIWQTRIGWSHKDGSSFTTARVTTNEGAFVQAQVVGDRVYYLINPSWGRRRGPEQKSYLGAMALAVSDNRGRRLRVLRTIEGIPGGTGGAAFRVTDGKLYLAYIQADESDRVHLFTGHMNLNGSGFHAIQRSIGDGAQGIPGVGQLGLTVVGHKVYYALVFVNTDMTAKEAAQQLFKKRTIGRGAITSWVAEAGVDDSGWRVTQRSNFPPDIVPRYKSIAVVGGKVYQSLTEYRPYSEHWEPFRPFLGTSGSNIVSKGDAYGLGLTEWNEARAFINAGEDYLFRAEAPADVSGAIADSTIDENWHFCAITYDRHNLKLYVDGIFKSSTPYRARIGRNPFPLVLGDGFVGIIDDAEIYDRALSAKEVFAASRRE